SGTGAATGPVLEETFPGLVFVHVRENPFLGARFGIRSIPVQVFYDKNGKEVFRHTGFLAEAEVMKQIEKMEVASK
ncbi:MAG: thioredoxin family protein, partial [Desulfococcaceae bacterium]